MKKYLTQSHSIFPSPRIEETAKYYEDVPGFHAVQYLDAKEPHICLYRDSTEIILTIANTDKVFPNRELYGYGYDAYFITGDQEELQNEFMAKGANIIRPLQKTDYHNQEFVIEDIDGRWIGFGIKGKEQLLRIMYHSRKKPRRCFTAAGLCDQAYKPGSVFGDNLSAHTVASKRQATPSGHGGQPFRPCWCCTG